MGEYSEVVVVAAIGVREMAGSVGDSYDCESVGAAWRA